MKKKFILSLLLCVFFCGCFAQTKYALLIGINKYYKNTTKLQTNHKTKKTDTLTIVIENPDIRLYGCENDVQAVQKLLIDSAGFDKQNIQVLLNRDASRKNILDQIEVLFKKSYGGTAFFYYSGHGTSFNYKTGQQEDTISKTTVEGICPSDIMLGVPYRVIQGTELAAAFKKFVNYQIPLTAIFDCCFSFPTTINSRDVSVPAMLCPTCPMDTIFITARPDSTTEETDILKTDVNKQDMLYAGSMKDYHLGKSRNLILPDTVWHLLESGFDYRKFYDDTIGPSQIPQSQFLFLSATNDKQKSKEKEMENNVYKNCGAFTEALINFYKQNPANSVCTDVLKQVYQKTSRYQQTPSLRAATARSDGNLFGFEIKRKPKPKRK